MPRPSHLGFQARFSLLFLFAVFRPNDYDYDYDFHSFDDGPAPYTPNLTNYLEEQGLTVTFFEVGSRVISRPTYSQHQHMKGNQVRYSDLTFLFLKKKEKCNFLFPPFFC